MYKQMHVFHISNVDDVGGMRVIKDSPPCMAKSCPSFIDNKVELSDQCI